MAYVKKEEYGPSEIYCDKCQFSNVEDVAVGQFASQITIDGIKIGLTSFSQKQLKIANNFQ